MKIALDFNISKVVGVLVSHQHGDHAKYVEEYKEVGVPIIAPWTVGEEIRGRIGKFTIQSFPLVHDVQCSGFLLHHPEIGKLVYITDTEYCKYRFKSLNHILVEANYSLDCMEPTDSPKRSHVLTGHMSIDTTVEFLQANKSPELLNVVLLHLSESNSDEAQFKAAAEAVADCPVWVADKGLEIELRNVPFWEINEEDA